jgi:hypothetical protein
MIAPKVTVRGIEIGPATVTLSLIDSYLNLLRALKTFQTILHPYILTWRGRIFREKATISLITILVHPKDHVFIDVYSLKSAAFTTAGNGGTTLKDILDVDYVD